MKIDLLRKSSRFIIAVAVGAGCLLHISTALAQDIDSFEAVEVKQPTSMYQVNAGMTYRTETDIDDGGEFSVLGFRVGGSGNWMINDQLRVAALTHYEYNGYDFSGAPFGRSVNPFGVDPWDDIHAWRMGALLGYKIDESWSIYGGPILTFVGEDDADFSHSFAGGGLAGFNYIFSETLRVGAAVGAFSQIEDDAAMFLFPTLDWMFCEDWAWHVGFSQLGSGAGVGTEVAYNLNEQWRVSLGALYQKRRFLLADDGPVPDGVGEDTAVPIYVKGLWKVAPKFDVEGHLGVTAGGELRLENDHGHKIAESDYDPSVQVGVRAVFRF